jgi:flagellar motor switch protein FliN/FliY
MSASVRPIHIPGAAACEALRRRVQAALDEWSLEWVCRQGGEAPRATVQIRTVYEGMSGSADEYETAGEVAALAWFRCRDADCAGFARAVTGQPLAAGPAADEGLGQAIELARRARNRALCAALIGEAMPAIEVALGSTPPATVFAMGSGAVELSCPAVGLHMIVDGSIWQRLRTSRRDEQRLCAVGGEPDGEPAVRSVLPLLGSVKLNVAVRVGNAEVSVAELFEMKQGAVLVLDRTVEAPLDILVDGHVVARGTLVAVGEHFGVRITETATVGT